MSEEELEKEKGIKKVSAFSFDLCLDFLFQSFDCGNAHTHNVCAIFLRDSLRAEVQQP